VGRKRGKIVGRIIKYTGSAVAAFGSYSR
jgi:hypothetical protein